MVARDRLHLLVERIAERDIPAAEQYLVGLESKHGQWATIEQALANAPDDDEPLTPEDRQAIAEGLVDLEAERTSSAEDVLRRLGIRG